MEGYRVGLTIALPAFDTYHILEQYARHPELPEVVCAYKYLRRRAWLELSFRASTMTSSSESADALYRALLGVSSGSSAPTGTVLANMSEEDLKALYLKACKAGGLNIDPSVFDKAKPPAKPADE